MVTQPSAPPRIIHCSRFLLLLLLIFPGNPRPQIVTTGVTQRARAETESKYKLHLFCARPRKTPAIIHFFFLSIQERKERRPTTFAYREIVSENDRGRRSHSLRIPTIFFVSGTKVKPWHPQPKKINETASELLLLSSSPLF